MTKRLLLISSSNVHGHGYLDHPEPEIRSFLGERRRVAFVPFAAHDHDGYTTTVRERLGRMDLDVVQLTDAAELENVDAVFVGGGNTFRLLKTLYERDLVAPLRAAVERGLSYMGSSAGSNIAGPTIRTTNDMPIVEVPTLDALGLIPFQINPHYHDVDPTSTHRGETREERLMQFHEENSTPVVALREGTALRIEGGVTTLVGDRSARIFRRGQERVEVEPGSAIDPHVQQ